MAKIVLSPDPILNQVCEDCVPGDKSLKKLAQEMTKAMYANGGCGIAAPQVGVSKRIIVVDCDGDERHRNPIVLVNPVIDELWGDDVTAGEGCLSLPGINIPITRKEWARVRYFDLDGEEWMIESDELLGRCLQHEIDHLDGKTLFESCDPSLRLRAVTAYERAKAAGARPGDTDYDVK